MGPLPHNLMIVKNSMSFNKMLHFDVPKSGCINSILTLSSSNPNPKPEPEP